MIECVLYIVPQVLDVPVLRLVRVREHSMRLCPSHKISPQTQNFHHLGEIFRECILDRLILRTQIRNYISQNVI